MRKTIAICLMLISFIAFGQEQSGSKQFWENLKKHCGKSYEGMVTEGADNDAFRNCDENIIRIPFFVGDDKSRTWVLTYKDNRIQLKHDHRLEDGSEDKVTQYGGTTTNSGTPILQFFPADQQTTDLIPYAASNVWWITIDETSFTYNLRRIGSDRLFTVKFDLTKTVATPSAPWGWKD